VSSIEKSAGWPPSAAGRVVLRGLLTFLCVVVVALCGTEVLLRVTDFECAQVSNGTYGSYRFDPELGWSAAPHAVSHFVSGNRSFWVEHNSIGLREQRDCHFEDCCAEQRGAPRR
jgi:hypothetical protein